MRVAVTGAAGFIGANMLRGLNAIGIDNIVAVDDLTDARKFHNLSETQIVDYIDYREFYDLLENERLGRFDAIIHEGACSDTMEHNGQLMMELNYRCSRRLLDACEITGTQLLYASSAAVYGNQNRFVEITENERPINIYGYSKLLFDNVVRRRISNSSQVAGFRYFNVYGPGEEHKDRMASVAFHHINQFSKQGRVRLFGAYDGWGAGEHSRDFIYVDDLVKVKLWFLEHPMVSGIFNIGTGKSQPFNDIALSVINNIRIRNHLNSLSLRECVQKNFVEYIEFPDILKGKYQNFTQADISKLRSVGYDAQFLSVEQGISTYIERLFRAGSTLPEVYYST